MYLTEKRYEGVVDVKQVVQRVNDGLVDLMGKLPGFVSFDCAESEDNAIVMTSLFETQVTAEESDSRAADWARENLGFLVPHRPKVTTGEVRAAGRSLS